MMKPRIAVAALSLLFVATSGWLAVRVVQQRDRIRLLEANAGTLTAAVPLAAPCVLEPAPSSSGPVSAVTQSHRRTPESHERCPDIDPLHSRLREANDSIAQARTRISELESQVEELNRDRARSATEETQLKSQVSELNQNIQAMHAENPQLAKRLKDAESDLEHLRQQAQTLGQKNTQFVQLIADFKEVARRQQVNATNIHRRYKELADLFRLLPTAGDGRGHAPEMSRIQSAVSMADEDLREMNDLNTRMNRLQNQLTSASTSR